MHAEGQRHSTARQTGAQWSGVQRYAEIKRCDSPSFSFPALPPPPLLPASWSAEGRENFEASRLLAYLHTARAHVHTQGGSAARNMVRSRQGPCRGRHV